MLTIDNYIADIDECLNDPCLHNGNCTNTDGSYTCSCIPQWTGYNCQNGKLFCIFSSLLCTKEHICVHEMYL